MVKNRKLIFLLFLLFSAALVVRLFFLSKGPFHYDTLDYIINGEKTLETLKLHYAHGAGYPLTVLLSAFIQLAAKTFGWAFVPTFIFTGALLAALAVCAFFVFAYAFSHSITVAMFSALIFNFFPEFFSVTTYGRIDHALECIMISLSFWILIKEGTASAKKYFLSSLLLGLAVTVRFSAFLAVIPWFIWYVYYRPFKKEMLEFRFLSAIAAGFCLPLIAVYLPMFADSGLTVFLNTLHDLRSGTQLQGLNLVFGCRAWGWEFQMFTLAGIYFIINGGFILWQESKRKVLLSLIFFFLPFIYFALLIGSAPRYYIWPSFVLFLAEGYALRRIYILKKYLAFVLCFIIILLMMRPVVKILTIRSMTDFQKEFAIYLEDIIEDGSVIIAEEQSLFLNYYMRRKNKILLSKPYTCQNEEMEKFFKHLEQFLSEGKNIYITYLGFSSDPCELFRLGVEKRFAKVLVGSKTNDCWSPLWGLYDDKVYKITKK